jgi:hypothetical protein
MVPERDRVFGLPPQLVFSVLFLVLALPSAFFLWASYDQLGTILERIEAAADAELPAHFVDPAVPAGSIATQSAIFLEYQVLRGREHRAGALLATRTWMRFMSLMFGAVLVVIGAAFVLGRITTAASKGELNVGGFKAAMGSTSPGLFLAAFGALLIAIPNVSTQDITVSDGAVYVGARPNTLSRDEQRDADISEILENISEREDEE